MVLHKSDWAPFLYTFPSPLCHLQKQIKIKLRRTSVDAKNQWVKVFWGKAYSRGLKVVAPPFPPSTYLSQGKGPLFTRSGRQAFNQTTKLSNTNMGTTHYQVPPDVTGSDAYSTTQVVFLPVLFNPNFIVRKQTHRVVEHAGKQLAKIKGD